MIRVKALSFSYGKHEVLKNVGFSSEYGEFLSILGANGAGKSTLFRCMLGLLTPSSGEVTVDGKRISSLSPAQRARLIAYIPQSHNPVFHYTVSDMVLMGTTAQLGPFDAPKKPQLAQAEEALCQLGISHLAHRPYGKLSGGERQLVLIARAIAQQARILLMDEPSANLDFGNRLRLMQTVKALTNDGYCVIQSTHDPEQAYLHCDKILALHDGLILAHGRPRDVFDEKLISKLYGVEVEVCKIKNDTHRVCVPKEVL